jgi:hypothetical protein
MRIAANEVLRRLAVMMAVADRIDLVDVVAPGFGLAGARTSTPARRSIGCTTVVTSLSGPISSQASCSARATASAMSIGTPSAFASESASPTSFFINPLVKPRLKVPGSTRRGNLSSVAVLRPLPALITSSMMRGSSPALTPITIASEVAAIAVAERKLLHSFIVCPAPGCSLMKNTLPITFSAGSTAATSARGPDTITASVPFSAPPTPPLTGESICTISRSPSVSKMRVAITEPVVDRSTKRRMRLPSISPPLPAATASTMSGVGRLAITVSTRSATSRTEFAASAPSATSRSIGSRRVSNTVTRWPASTRRRAIGKPILPSPMKPISMCAPFQRFPIA